jgi:hypothetical protein
VGQTIYSILLIPKPNESATDQELSLRLERGIQEQLNKSIPDKDVPFHLVSAYLPMVAMWLGPSACGRVLRLRLDSDGRFIDATDAAEADRLIGPGKTLGTLAAAFADQANRS